MQRREFIIGAAATVASATPLVQAQGEWPARPIKLIVGYPPGGAADAVGREILPFLQKALGQPLVLDYRAGAGGAIAAEALSRSESDGYTLGMLDNGPLTVVPNLRKVSYDPVKNFTSIASVTAGGLLIVAKPGLPVNTVEELMAYAKKNPGKLSYASAGQGSLHHLAGELLKMQTNTFMVHVPYRGSSASLTDVAGGQIDVAVATVASSLGLARDGRIKVLATTSARRLAALPDVPSIHEKVVPGYNVIGWFGFFGPPNLPKPIVQKLGAAIKAYTKDKDAIRRTQALGGDLADGTAEELSEWVQKDMNRWGRIIKHASIRAE